MKIILLLLFLLTFSVALKVDKDANFIDETGSVVKLHGLNWFGYNTNVRVVHGLWNGYSVAGDFATILHRMKLLGFNAIRVPFSFQEFKNATAGNYIEQCYLPSQKELKSSVMPAEYNRKIGQSLPQMTSVPQYSLINGSTACNSYLPLNSTFDRFLFTTNSMAENGFYVVVDNHLREDPTAVQNKTLWVQSWVNLATALAANPETRKRIILDLLNEPDHEYELKWEGNSTTPGITDLYLEVMDAIEAAVPGLMFGIEGTGQVNGLLLNMGDGFATDPTLIKERNLSDPNRFFTEVLTKPYRDRVVLMPHVYGPSVTGEIVNQTGPGLYWRLSTSFGEKTLSGYCSPTNASDCQVFGVIIGEFGSKMFPNMTEDLTFLNDFREYLLNQGEADDSLHRPIADWMYWSWNPNSGDTGGLVQDDWLTIEWRKIFYLESLGLNPWYVSSSYMELPQALPITWVGVVTLGAWIVMAVVYVLYFGWFKGKKDASLEGAVRLAAARGDVEALEALSHAPGFDVDSPREGFTALHAAAVQGKRDAALWLLQRNADVHAVKEDGWDDSALHYAAAHGDIETVEVILAFGATPDKQNSVGLTPAAVAMNHKHTAVADRIAAIANGAERPLSREEVGVRVGSGYAAQSVPPHGDKTGSKNISADESTDNDDPSWKLYVARAWDGLGSEGVVLHPKTKVFRIIAALQLLVLVAYILWRALRSLTPQWYYFYSVPVYFLELCFYPPVVFFIFAMWNRVQRKERWASDMLSEEKLPAVDVYIVRYKEPTDVVEPPIIAALNMNWPGVKLSVYLLDDGSGPEGFAMVKRIRDQAIAAGRSASLNYVQRRKVPGVVHHAKAGNINHALLNSHGKGEFVLVLDCDHIVHPDFLQRTIGHFYVSNADGKSWRRKEKAGFLQVPQDFYNISPQDPLGHGNRIFFGPIMEGRDGCGGVICCGTGVIFPRDGLVSIGGQSYGSITEDCNTSLTLTTCGFSSMYLGERIVYGLAPDDLDGVLSQRLRWSMGSLQILLNNNPLSVSGLSIVQKCLFFDAVTYPLVAISMFVFVFVPIIFVFSWVSPVNVIYLWEFCITFGVFWIINRSMWLYVAVGSYGGETELWRSWQAFIWTIPNNLKAIWKVMTAEMTFFSWISFKKKAITFKVTDKSSTATKPSYDWKTFWLVLPYLFVYLVLLVALVAVIVFGATKSISLGDLIGGLFGLMWTFVACVCVWPVVSTLFPRRQTAEGWEIQWSSRNNSDWNGVGKVALDHRASTCLDQLAISVATVLGDRVDGKATLELNLPSLPGEGKQGQTSNGQLSKSPFEASTKPGLQRTATLLGMTTETFLQTANSVLSQAFSTAVTKRGSLQVRHEDVDLVGQNVAGQEVLENHSSILSASDARHSRAINDIFTCLGSNLQKDGSLVIPVDTKAVFEQAINTQPSFEQREAPAILHVYAVITIALTLSLVAIGICSGLEIF